MAIPIRVDTVGSNGSFAKDLLRKGKLAQITNVQKGASNANDAMKRYC